MTAPVLDIRGLSISYATEAGPLKALRDVNLQVGEGSIIGIVGESGCGKSTLISAIIHMNSLEQNVDLYKKIFDALVPGGRIVIRDHVMKPDRTIPKAGALFAINMLVGTPTGGTYTYDEIKTGLTAAGFENVNLIRESEAMMGLVEAFRPL